MQAMRDNPNLNLVQRIAVKNLVSTTNPEDLDHRSRPALLRGTANIAFLQGAAGGPNAQ
jgi:hypothetical protein